MDILYKALFSIAGVAVLSFLIPIVLRLIFEFSYHSKPLAKIIGFVLASIGAFFSLTYYNELRDIPVHPEQVSIENITGEMSTKDHAWVSILDGKWDCNNVAYNGRNTYAALSNKAETLIIVANFDEEKTCQELQGFQPAGRLDEFARREFTYTANYIDFSRYGPNASLLSLCTYCGRQNSQLGIAMGIALALFGLFYDKFAMWNPSRRTNTATPPPLQLDSMN